MVTNISIEDGDKIIAKFMGVKWEAKEGVSRNGCRTYKKQFATESECKIYCDEINRYKTLNEVTVHPFLAIGGINSKLKYHSSWDWLVPVWKKFYDTVINTEWYVDNHTQESACEFSCMEYALCTGDINNAFKHFVNLLNWHNSTKQSTLK